MGSILLFVFVLLHVQEKAKKKAGLNTLILYLSGLFVTMHNCKECCFQEA